jgi:hypothetical protein
MFCVDGRAHRFPYLSTQNQGAQNLVLGLMLTLQSQPPACALPLGTLLASQYSRISSTAMDIKLTKTLLGLVPKCY